MSKNVVALSVLFGVLGVFIWNTYVRSPVDPASHAHLSKLATEVNQTLPKMLDEDTEMVTTEGADHLMVYHYRLVKYAAQDLDVQKVREALSSNLRKNACRSPETRDKFLLKGVTLRYSYADKDRRPVVSIDVNGRDCEV